MRHLRMASHLLSPSITMQPRRFNRGFTLVEVLVVLAIIGAAFLLVPSILEMIRGTQLEQTGREASVLLQKARLSAIKQTAPAVVMVDEDTNSFFAFVDRSNPMDSTFQAADGDEELGRVEIRRGITATPVKKDLGDTDPYKAEFTSTGGVENTGSFVFADASGKTITLKIGPTATGHIEVVK